VILPCATFSWIIIVDPGAKLQSDFEGQVYSFCLQTYCICLQINFFLALSKKQNLQYVYWV